MADRIKGITIEIGGETTKLQSALKGVNSTIRTTQSQLKDVEKLLKLDPTNTELLRQKQQLLGEQVKATKEKLDTLKEAQAQMNAEGVDKNSSAYMALQREIAATENELRAAETAARNFNVTLAKVSATASKVSEAAAKAAQKTRGLSTAAAGALTGIAGMAYKAATTADDLNTLAKQTGFTTDELQKMQYAADRIDVPMETITSAAARMTKQLSSSEDKFTSLGVATRDSQGNFRSTTDIFYDTVTALSKVQNETERDALAMELFGRSANELAGVIDDGGAALREFGTEAENAGLILDQDTLNGLNAVNDQIDKLKAQGMATLAKTGAAALEALTPVIEKVASAVEKVLGFIAQLSPQQMQVIMTILAVVAAISPLLSIVSKLSTAISLLSSPIGIAIAAIGALIAIGVALYQNWDEIKEKATTIWNNIKTAITTPIEAAKNTVKNIIDSIKRMFNFEVSFPHIKMPHFNWTWNDLGIIKIPNISVQWYKKAYDTPYMFNRPTIAGFGDGNGGEMVYGKESLMNDIKTAMASAHNQPIVITVQSVLDGKIIGQSVTRYQRNTAMAMGA